MPVNPSSNFFRSLKYQETHLKVLCEDFDTIKAEVKGLQRQLKDYISQNPLFSTTLKPLPENPLAPLIVQKMLTAANLCNVGPLAAVAGALAEETASVLIPAEENIIVNNGGDIYLKITKEVVVGLFSGTENKGIPLGFKILPEDTPLAICSSSSTMGHSFSLGKCDLATVISKSGALADAAATRACNLVQEAADLKGAASAISSIPGIIGVILFKSGQIALAGKLPKLIKLEGNSLNGKIVFDPDSNFMGTQA